MNIIKKLKNKIILYPTIILSVICIFFIFKAYMIIFNSNVNNFKEKQISFFIKSNDTFDSILKKINPLLKRPEHFKILAEYKNYPKNIKPGHFIIKKGMGNNSLINNLISGNTPVLISFNNKNSIEKLAQYLASKLEPDSISFINAIKNNEFITKEHLISENILCAYIPNTYEAFWNTTAEKFISKIISFYNQFWNKSRIEKAKKLDLSKIDICILASIIQRETYKNEEKNTIAGVYINRLKNKWRLQADPTVLYILKQQKPNKNIRRILYKDTDINSPYNTYKHIGLPPGPISMPDISSIDAVLNYEKHNYFYFVADFKRPGYHIFSKTLRSHNSYKKGYTKWLNKKKIYR